MRQIQNAVISVAGYDPCAGAGVLADIKTFEQIGVYGCAISTSITYQNDTDFDGIKWLSNQEITSQFEPLKQRFKFHFAKIGLVENIVMLEAIISMLKNYNPGIIIIWDPVLKTSSGFSIHHEGFENQLNEVLDNIFLITPNSIEYSTMKIDNLKPNCHVLVTGGHDADQDSIDTLYFNGNVVKIIGPRLYGYEKHGSGCVSSAAITAFLAQGNELEEACRKAKDYTFQFLCSSSDKLGNHYQIKIKQDAATIPN